MGQNRPITKSSPSAGVGDRTRVVQKDDGPSPNTIVQWERGRNVIKKG